MGVGPQDAGRPLNVLVWHVHGGYMTSLVQGPHRWLLPVREGGTTGGRWPGWPATALDLWPEAAADTDIDVVILQRPEDLAEAEHWLGRRRLGREVAAVWLEHNTPDLPIASMRHPLADRSDIPVVHCTHFNALFWDCGAAPTTVIEHGVVDPGPLYTGELPRAAVVINEARRRGRSTGTDLLARFEQAMPVDLFGIDAAALGGTESLPTARLHAAMARRRAYLHPNRWTSLGLSLLEAMHLAMPVVALSTTEVAEAVPAGAGVVSNRIDVLQRALRHYAHEPQAARAAGLSARRAALQRYGLDRFTADWDRLLREVAGTRAGPG